MGRPFIRYDEARRMRNFWKRRRIWKRVKKAHPGGSRFRQPTFPWWRAMPPVFLIYFATMGLVLVERLSCGAPYWLLGIQALLGCALAMRVGYRRLDEEHAIWESTRMLDAPHYTAGDAMRIIGNIVVGDDD